MSKRKSVNLNLPEALHEVVANTAKKEHRTIVNFIEKILMEATNFEMQEIE